MRFAQIRVGGPMMNFAYVIADDSRSSSRGPAGLAADKATGEGAVIDPGADGEVILLEAKRLGVRVTHVLLTHSHWDHVNDVEFVKEKTGAKVCAWHESPVPHDVPLKDGDVLKIGNLEAKVIHTPGHIEDAVCYVANGRLFTGDTLFIGECGRVDLPGSDPEKMWNSLNNVLPKLPGDLVVCPGHDYGPKPTDTLANQLKTNYTLKPRTLEQFIEFMTSP